MNDNFVLKQTITRTSAEKIIITISRKQLWLNFMKFWSEYALDDTSESVRNLRFLQEIYHVLVTDKPLSRQAIWRLFHDEKTVFLMDEEGMKALETEDALKEIVVIDDMGNDRPNIIVPHEYISY
jgi:hypothetical protein